MLDAVLGLDDDFVGRFVFGFDSGFGRHRAGDAVDGWPLLGVCRRDTERDHTDDERETPKRAHMNLLLNHSIDAAHG